MGSSETVSYRLSHGRVVLLEALPSWRGGSLVRRWRVLGRVPAARGRRRTLADGSLGVVDGRMTIARGCASLELLELVRAAVEAGVAGELLVTR